MADDRRLEHEEERAEYEERGEHGAEELEYEEGRYDDGARTQAPPPRQSAGSDLPVKEGAIFGVGAFALAYAVFYQVVSAATAASGGAAEGDPSTWVDAGLTFLATHGVAIELAGEQTEYAFIETAQFLVPIAVLIAAGYGIVRYTGARTLEEGVKSALTIVPGYAVPALLLAVLATHDVGEQTLSAATGDAILFAGILVPAVFGIVGALLATWPAPVDRVLAQIE